MMKILSYSFLLMLFIPFSCNNNAQEKEEFIPFAPWKEIQDATHNNNIEFLLGISNDTLQCASCNAGIEFYSKEVFFSDYLNELKEVRTREYQIISRNIIDERGRNISHYIMYSDENCRGKECSTTVYMLDVKKESEFQYLGYFTIP